MITPTIENGGNKWKLLETTCRIVNCFLFSIIDKSLLGRIFRHVILQHFWLLQKCDKCRILVFVGILLILSLLSIPQEYALCDRLIYPSVCLSVSRFSLTITQERLDVEWWNLVHIHLRSRVTSNMEFEDGSRTWPLTLSNWRFPECTFRVHARLHSVHVYRTHSCGILVCMCYISLFCMYWDLYTRPLSNWTYRYTVHLCLPRNASSWYGTTLIVSPDLLTISKIYFDLEIESNFI